MLHSQRTEFITQNMYTKDGQTNANGIYTYLLINRGRNLHISEVHICLLYCIR